MFNHHRLDDELKRRIARHLRYVGAIPFNCPWIPYVRLKQSWSVAETTHFGDACRFVHRTRGGVPISARCRGDIVPSSVEAPPNGRGLEEGRCFRCKKAAAAACYDERCPFVMTHRRKLIRGR
jgi:hypothetical protein